MQVPHFSPTDAQFNPPDVFDNSERDLREANEEATTFITGDKSYIYDVITDETLQLDNLSEILAALNVCNDRNIGHWVGKLRDEFAVKLAKAIELRAVIELAKINEAEYD